MKIYTLRFRHTDKKIFDQIKTGSKWVETRAATVKYRNIRAEDVLVLVCGKEKFEKKIKKSTIFKSISALLKAYKVGDIMPDIKDQKSLEKACFSYPGYREKIRKFGIIALEL